MSVLCIAVHARTARLLHAHAGRIRNGVLGRLECLDRHPSAELRMIGTDDANILLIEEKALPESRSQVVEVTDRQIHAAGALRRRLPRAEP